MYCIDIGPVAAAKVVNSKIFPIKYKTVVSIAEELAKLSDMLSSNPPPFIKKMQAQRV
jgi:nitrogen fixation protein NifX